MPWSAQLSAPSGMLRRMLLPSDDYIRALEVHGRALADVAAQVDLTTPAPDCPYVTSWNTPPRCTGGPPHTFARARRRTDTPPARRSCQTMICSPTSAPATPT